MDLQNNVSTLLIHGINEECECVCRDSLHATYNFIFLLLQN